MLEILWLILYLLIALLPPVALLVVVLIQFMQPLRRRERVRLFLDLIVTGLAQGRAPEQTVVEISNTRENSLGRHLHRVAAHVQRGMRLSSALEQSPSFLPPQVGAALSIGEQMGDVGRVIPICRAMTGEFSAKAASVQRFVAAWPLLLSLGGSLILLFLSEVVLPKFHMIVEDLTEGAPLPVLTAWVFDHIVVAMLITALPALGLLLLAWSDSRLPRWLRRGMRPWADRMAFWLPWRRLQLQRDFSATLALMLDARLHEPEAVTRAAQCTDNCVFIQRARQAVERLRAGVPLIEAVTAFDAAGEFRWRLANASQTGNRFAAALEGWHQALAAKAFQAEQTAVQLFIAALILLNGVAVGCVVIAVFRVLTTIVTEMAIW